MTSTSAKSSHSIGLSNVADGGHAPDDWLGLADGELDGLDELDGLGEFDGLCELGPPELGVTGPLQAAPLRLKLAGTGLALLFHEPLKPKLADPPVGMLALCAALTTLTC